jgi:3-oxoacyl-(acyl-carrier-protein) synthase
MQEETGVIFASSFPALDSILEESKRFYGSKEKKLGQSSDYAYNRKLLFKVLVMANAQLAELIKAKGPNMQINTACSGTTEAISLAEDWIRTRRCQRVLVIAADNPTSPNLLPYLGTGFLTLGAATICGRVSDAAVPFDNRRKGMILGSGAVGLVVEALSTCLQRGGVPKVEILGTHIANSAYHASMLDYEHIASHLSTFLKEVERKYGITKRELAQRSLYFSHETCTSVCAKTELDALAKTFGEYRSDLLITNTKAMTGHAMGVGMEDAIAVESLHVGKVPPVLNYKERDPTLGDISLALLPEDSETRPVSSDSSDSQTISHTRPYALRFAAGFGSHFGFLLLRKYNTRD